MTLVDYDFICMKLTGKGCTPVVVNSLESEAIVALIDPNLVSLQYCIYIFCTKQTHMFATVMQPAWTHS